MKKLEIKRLIASVCSAAMVLTSFDMTSLSAIAATTATTGVQTEDQTGVESEETEKNAATQDIAVLSTTDMHGKSWDTNVLNDTSVTNSMLRVSSAVSEIRSQYGEDNVLLIDNGDLFQGTPVSTYNITTADDSFTGETPMAICLKYLNYDALSLGNHEFNYPWSTMTKVYSYLQNEDDVNGDGKSDSVDVISANLVYTNTEDGNTAGDNVFTPYILKDITVGDTTVTVGVLGLENTDCTRWDVADNYPNISFAHDLQSMSLTNEVQTYVPEMQAKGADYIIVSYHSGLGDTTDTSSPLVFGTNTENQAARIIANTTGVDMMICGHDHSTAYSNTSYSNAAGEDVLVVNGGGTEMTKTVVTATEETDGTVSFTTGGQNNVTLTGYEDDETLKALIAPYASAATTYVNTASGSLGEGDWDTKTDSSTCYVEQTDTMDLINRSQITEGEKYLEQKYSTEEAKEAVKSEQNYTSTDDVCTIDFSATSVVLNSTAYTGLKAGELSIKDIYKFYKYDNNLYVLPMTGQQIKDCLEYVAANRLGYTIKNGTITYKTINDYFTCPVFYGLDFTYDLSKEEGNRVTITGFKNGKEFDLDRTYNLAINNYHLSNGPFASYTTSDTIWSQTDDLGGGNVQDLIAEFVEDGGEDGTGVVPNRSNWSITYSAEIPAADETEEAATTEVYDPIADTVFSGDYADAVNVKEAAAKKNGTGTVIGQVVYGYGKGDGDHNSYVIEDVVDGQICGYLVYDYTNEYKVGDIVAVTGTFTVYSGVPELTSVTAVNVIESLGADQIIQPQVVTVDELMNQTDDEYLNEYVVIQNVPASKSSIAGTDKSITIYSGASLPEGLAANTAADIYGVCSTYYETTQLRTGSSDSYVAHTGTYDPVDDSLYTEEGISTLADVYSATGTVTVYGQVTAKYSSSADGDRNNIILQDVINGETVGLVTYDKSNAYNWYVGDVVKVTGTVGAYGGVKQLTPTDVTRVKTAVSFQPQVVTVSQLGDDYLSELVTIKDATLGAYAESGSTSVTDSTGSTNIYKAPAFPGTISKGDTVALTAVCSAYNGTTQLKVCRSTDYVKAASSTETVVDETLVRVPVVETTDVHGFLVDVSSGNEDTYQYRMAYIADKVNDLRENSDVLLLDGGDIYQGNPVSNLLEGQSMTAAYDAMDYDAVGLGNHEFDWDVTSLADSLGTMGSYSLADGTIAGDSDIPVLCWNLYDAATKTKTEFTQDYIIVEKTGKALDGTTKTYKIAVFGYAEDYSADIMAAKIAPYTIDEDDLEDIEKQSALMEAEGTVDASVLLSHADAAGIAKELNSDTTIDLVCGGHTHSSQSGTVKSNGVTYVEAKNQAQAYCYAELCFDADGNVTVENTDVISTTTDKTKLYNTEANADELDAEIVKISDAAVAAVSDTMNEELGTITSQVTKTAIDGNSYSSTAGTFTCELMNAATGADVSFTNNGGIRTEFTFDGSSKLLTAGDIYTIAPFCNTLPTFTMTYEKLKEIVEYSVSSSASALALRMGGATAYYDNNGVTTLFVGNTLVYADNAWVVSKDTEVTVCTNEYIATASGTPFAAMTSNETAAGVLAVTDNESFIAALKKEAAANDGAIHVNTEATLVSGSWDGKTYPTVFETPEETPEETTEYTVSFDANNSKATGTMADQSFVYDEEQNLTANGYKLSGYTFKGWATSKSGSVVYADKASVKNLTDVNGGNVTLYAVWSKNAETTVKYTVSFNANNSKATGKMSSVTMTYNKAQTLSANSFKLTGYTFSGWATSKNGKVVYKDKQSVKNLAKTNGAKVTLYAVWTANTYKVAFYDNSSKATGKMSAQTLTYDKSTKLTSNKFKLAGYTFKGWATKKTGSVKYKNSASVKNLTATKGSTIKLYAVWEKVTVKTTSISSVKSSKLKMTVKWKKTSGAAGYVITYSKYKNFKKSVKTVTVKSGSTTSKTISGLKKGTKYYVKVQAYKTDSKGSKVLGKCKKTTSVVIKK